MADFAQQMGALSAESNAHRQEETLHRLHQIHDKVMKDFEERIKAKAAGGCASVEWATGWIPIQKLLGPEMSATSVCKLAAQNFDEALLRMGFQAFKVSFKIDRKEEPNKSPCLHANFAFMVNWATQEGEYVSKLDEQLRMQQHEQQMLREKQHRLQTYQEHPTRLREFNKLVGWINTMMTTTARGPGRSDRPWKVDAFLDQMVAYMEHDPPSLKKPLLYTYDQTKENQRFLFGSHDGGEPIAPGEEERVGLRRIHNGFFIAPKDYKSAGKGYEFLEFRTRVDRTDTFTRNLSTMHNCAINYTIGWWEKRNRSGRTPCK